MTPSAPLAGRARDAVAALLAPHDLEAFTERHWNRGFAALPGTGGGSGWRTALFPDGIEAVCGALARLGRLDAIADGSAVRHDGAGDVAACLSAGRSVRARRVHEAHRGLADLCWALGRTFGARAHANLYATPPGRDGLDPHFDEYNVFVLQIEGAKRWTLYEPSAAARLATWPGPVEEADRAHAQEVELSVGDILYMTRGVGHRARCGPERGSVHVTIGLRTLTYADLLRNAVARAARLHEPLRRDIPQRYLTGEGPIREAPAHEAQARTGAGGEARAGGVGDDLASCWRVIGREDVLAQTLRTLAAYAGPEDLPTGREHLS